MWKCNFCGKTLDDTPEDMKCPSCGLTIGTTDATREKLQILHDICNLNDYAVLIDACAGSGKVQLDGEMIDGSAVVLENIAKKRNPPAKRIFIEADPKTFRLLRWRFGWSFDAQFINDDCNKHLLKFVDGKNKTLVFIDPFGYGLPAIRRNIILELSRTPNTDLLINFTWRIAREMGYARTYLCCTIENCPSPTKVGEQIGSCDQCRNRRTAISYANSATIWWGDQEWLNWGSLAARDYAEKYASPLRSNCKVQIYNVPGYSRNPTYQLIFATKFECPKYGIEKWLQ
jgi:three-Cys-motif partner protein